MNYESPGTCPGRWGLNSQDEATMLTMMDVVVLELWIRAVTRTPITIPATGLDKIKLLLKNCPATFPEKQTESPDVR